MRRRDRPVHTSWRSDSTEDATRMRSSVM
jgi:hypothetical protein